MKTRSNLKFHRNLAAAIKSLQTRIDTHKANAQDASAEEEWLSPHEALLYLILSKAGLYQPNRVLERLGVDQSRISEEFESSQSQPRRLNHELQTILATATRCKDLSFWRKSRFSLAQIDRLSFDLPDHDQILVPKIFTPKPLTRTSDKNDALAWLKSFAEQLLLDGQGNWKKGSFLIDADGEANWHYRNRRRDNLDFGKFCETQKQAPTEIIESLFERGTDDQHYQLKGQILRGLAKAAKENGLHNLPVQSFNTLIPLMPERAR